MNLKTEAFRQDFHQRIIPANYSGQKHVIFNFGLLLAVMVLSLSQLQNSSPILWVLFPLMMILGNLVVFLVHKYPLHRPGVNSYAFKMHTTYHHHFFTHDHITYQSSRDFWILFFPPEVVGSFSLLVCPVVFFSLKALISVDVAAIITFSAASYFLLYEVFHYASHLPVDHWVLRMFPPFAYMREHHRLHHDPRLMSKYNFNIVFPLFDFLFKTKYLGPSNEK